MKDYLNFWKRYFDFHGHSTISEFLNAWLWYIFTGFVIMISSTMIMIACSDMAVHAVVGASETLLSIFGFVSLSPCLAITVRRLRDAGYSPKSFFWLLLPGFGFIAFLVRLFSKSVHNTDGKNVN